MKDGKDEIQNNGQAEATKTESGIDVDFNPDKFTLESEDELNATNLRSSQNYAGRDWGQADHDHHPGQKAG